jgi:hypothetical protein
MARKRNEALTTNLEYPMVDLFTGGTVMPLMFVNVVTTGYLLSLTAPWLFTQAWIKELERESVLHNQSAQNCSSSESTSGAVVAL